MQVKQSSLLQSAVKKEQWPQSELPELIMVGRSNAGKSSFINALCNRKNLAYVGKQPGKTRILNFFLINKPSNLKKSYQMFINQKENLKCRSHLRFHF